MQHRSGQPAAICIEPMVQTVAEVVVDDENRFLAAFATLPTAARLVPKLKPKPCRWPDTLVTNTPQVEAGSPPYKNARYRTG